MTGVTTLNELLDTQAAAAPDAEAITDGTTRLTWREYRDQAARLGQVLHDLGIEPGDRVGVHLPKSVMSFVAVHAVLRIGAVMVPLDSLAPATHTASVLVDAGARVLITGARAQVVEAIASQVDLDGVVMPTTEQPSPVGTIAVRGCAALDTARPIERVEVVADDLAYLMYTSGSTGQPKGMVHTHGSGLAYARLACETYGLVPDDRLANIAPLHFDQSTFELYAAPLAGASVLVVPDPVLRFPASLASLIESEQVTVWYSVPFVLEQLASRGSVADRDMTTLRWILYGGEAFPPAALARVMTALPSARVSNVYGPAEVNQCTFFHLDEPPVGDDPIPIGDAWPGAELRVVDSDGVPVSSGEAGELLVSSDTMMRGYWNRPDLDSQSIVERDERRWYRTGDSVVARDDGALVFLGRIDNQVKVRGHRVEIEAVEAALLGLDGVEAVAVIVERPADGDDSVVAVVSPANLTDEASASELRRQLAAMLPRYAVPSRLIGLDRLPRTSSGKVDRRAAAVEASVDT